MTIAKSDETATSPALIEEDFEDFWEPPPPGQAGQTPSTPLLRTPPSPK